MIPAAGSFLAGGSSGLVNLGTVAGVTSVYCCSILASFFKS